MKKFLKYFFLIGFFLNMSCARSENVVVMRYFISNIVSKMAFNTVNVVNNMEHFTSKDNIIYYVAQFMIIEPSKKKYNLTFKCIDKNNALIFQSKQVLLLPSKLDLIAGEKIWSSAYYLGFDPRLGNMVPGQIKPLEDNQDYFIKLYLDKKLIGVTYFNYRI